MEIERKWLINKIPEIVLPDGTPDSLLPEEFKIEQFYLSTNPEVRLRECVAITPSSVVTDGRYTITVKSNGGLVREEFEVAVPKAFYNGCKSLIDKPACQKRLLWVHGFGNDIEMSVVDDGVFMYAEVEFETQEEANAYVFPFPEIVIREVTGDKRYSMKNYWKNGGISN